MVRLTRLAAGLLIPVLGKCEFVNPGGSVKDRIALAIVEEAERAGRLAPGATLVEATAGNTGLGLALVAAARGYRLVCVLPEKMSVDKRVALAAVGAEVMVTANAPPSSPENFQNVARRLAAERGWFLTDQFANPANPIVHERTTGPEILAQCGGRGRGVCHRGRNRRDDHRGRPVPEGSLPRRANRPGRPRRVAAGIPGGRRAPGSRRGLPGRGNRGKCPARGVCDLGVIDVRPSGYPTRTRSRSPLQVDPGGGAARRGIFGDDRGGGVAARGTRGLRRPGGRRAGRLVGPVPLPTVAAGRSVTSEPGPQPTITTEPANVDRRETSGLRWFLDNQVDRGEVLVVTLGLARLDADQVDPGLVDPQRAPLTDLRPRLEVHLKGGFKDHVVTLDLREGLFCPTFCCGVMNR